MAPRLIRRLVEYSTFGYLEPTNIVESIARSKQKTVDVGLAEQAILYAWEHLGAFRSNLAPYTAAVGLSS